MTTIGLVGCGQWGANILRDLKTLGCRVHVVARSPETRRRAEQGGAASVVSSTEHLPDVDGFVIAVPISHHASVITALLPRHVPIFCEKPICNDVETARELVAAAPDRLFVMDKWRYHRGVEALGAFARSGELGSILGLRTTRVGWQSRPRDVDVLWYLAPHDLVIARDVLGTIPPLRDVVPETFDGRLYGLLAIFGPSPHLVIDLSERRRRHVRELRLMMEQGVAVLRDSYDEALAVSRRGPDNAFSAIAEELRPFAAEMPLLRELAAFVAHVKGGPPPLSSAREGLEIVERIDEIARAISDL